MNEQEKTARAAGAAAAEKVVRAQASAGVSTDRIEAHGADTASWLFSEAKTTEGRAFAAGYNNTAQTLVGSRGAGGRGDGAWPGGLGGGLVIVGEQHGREAGVQVPGDVVRQHPQEHVVGAQLKAQGFSYEWR